MAHGTHLPIHTGDGTHEHPHEHPGHGMHSHPHMHKLDGVHLASDGDHLHVPGDDHGLKPVPKKGHTVIKRKAALAGGHNPDELAAVYAARGDEVLVALSHLDDGDPPVMLTPGDFDGVSLTGPEVLNVADGLNMTTAEVLAACAELNIETEPVGLTAPSVVTGAEVELTGPADLDAAEAELAAMSAGGSQFGLSAGDALAADDLAGEVNRLSMLHQQDQLRAAGHRVPRGFTS
jgi:hypothetical protein